MTVYLGCDYCKEMFEKERWLEHSKKLGLNNFTYLGCPGCGETKAVKDIVEIELPESLYVIYKDGEVEDSFSDVKEAELVLTDYKEAYREENYNWEIISVTEEHKDWDEARNNYLDQQYMKKALIEMGEMLDAHFIYERLNGPIGVVLIIVFLMVFFYFTLSTDLKIPSSEIIIPYKI